MVSNLKRKKSLLFTTAMFTTFVVSGCLPLVSHPIEPPSSVQGQMQRRMEGKLREMRKKCHCPQNDAIVGEMLLSPDRQTRINAEKAIACFTYIPDTMIFTYHYSVSGESLAVDYKVKEYPLDPYYRYINAFADSLYGYIDQIIIELTDTLKDNRLEYISDSTLFYEFDGVNNFIIEQK